MSEELLIYLEVPESTFQYLMGVVVGGGIEGVDEDPARICESDTRRHLRIGSVVFVENTPRPININLSVSNWR